MKQMMSEMIYKDLKKIVSVGKDGEKESPCMKKCSHYGNQYKQDFHGLSDPTGMHISKGMHPETSTLPHALQHGSQQPGWGINPDAGAGGCVKQLW